MIWGFITWNGVGKIVKTSNKMNSDEYKTIINNGLFDFLVDKQIDPKSIIFQQDNASCHKSKKVLDHFQNNQIALLYWPPNSPDLNPIENVWNFLEKQIRKSGIKFSSDDHLWNEIEKEWYKIPLEIIRNLFSSMKTRIVQLKKSNFNATNY